MTDMIEKALWVAVAILASCLVTTASAHAAPRWLDGNLATEIKNVNCVSMIQGTPYLETEIGAYVGQYVDPEAASPAVGEVFDVHLVVATIGNECAGTRPKLEIALPPGVSPALTPQVGIRCYLSSGSGQPFGAVTAGQGCPTTVRAGTTNHPSISNWISLDPEPGSPAAPAWPLPRGATIEIQVPVVADRVMNGIGDPSGCVCVVASVQTINGISRPDDAFTWAHGSPSSGARIPLFVFPGAPTGGSDPGTGSGGGTTPGDATGPARGEAPAAAAPAAAIGVGPVPSGTGTTVDPAPATAPSTPGPSGTSPGVATPRVTLPAALRRATLRTRSGAPLRLSNLRRGDRIQVSLTAGRRTLAVAKATATGSRRTVRVRSIRQSALARARTARLRVVVRRDGRKVLTRSRTVRLR